MLDLFAGVGVAVAAKSLGILEDGVEIAPEVVRTRDVAGFHTPYSDVWEIEKAQSLDTRRLWASPPCQSYSISGKGNGRRALDRVIAALRERRWEDIDSLRELSVELGEDGDKTSLVLTPLAYIHRYRPEWVAFEQVSTVLPVWEQHCGPLEEMGYSVWVGNIQAEMYGVAQARKRAYLVARRDGVQAAPPKPTHSRFYPRTPERIDPGVRKWVTMSEALGWKIGSVGDERPEWCFKRPSTTIVADPRIGGPGRSEFVKGGVSRQNRPGSIRLEIDQAAALQSFPQDLMFSGGKGKQFLQVGNAVPPLVARAFISDSLDNTSQEA